MQHEAIHTLFQSAIRGRSAPAILRVTDHGTGSTAEAARGMGADSPLLLASITKLATGACLLRAADRGLLALSDPVLAFLDDDVAAPLASVPGSSSLTVADLLYQTSGLPDPFEAGPNLGKRVVQQDFTYTAAEMASWAAEMKQHPRKPDRANYSDANFDLLGNALATIHGKPYPEVLRAEIAEPLGLTELRIPAPGEEVPAVEYRGTLLSRPEFIRSNGASGGALATALELERFVVGLFTGELTGTDLLLDPAGYHGMGLAMGPVRYGPGAMRIEAGYPFGGKVELYGHIGSTGAFAFWVPEKRASIVGSLNRFGAGPAAVRLAIKAALKL